MNLFLTSIFFMPIFPLAPIIGCAGMFISYWVDKILLLRRHKRPEELSGELSIFFANIVPYCCLLQAFSLVLFSEKLVAEYNLKLPEGLKEVDLYVGFMTLPRLGLLASILAVLMPIRVAINHFLGSNEALLEESEYKDNFLNFFSDYDRENPITKREGAKRLLEFRKQIID